MDFVNFTNFLHLRKQNAHQKRDNESNPPSY